MNLLSRYPVVLLLGSLAGSATAQNRPDPVFTSAAFRTDVRLTSNTALLELTTTDPKTDRVRISIDTLNTVEFADDGLLFDRVRGDGVFTGIVPANMDEEQRVFTDVLNGLGRGTPIPQFDGRELTHIVRSDELMPRKTRGMMPVLTTSASTTVQIDHSVAITSVDVLEDPLYTFNPCTGVGTPNGAWTFGHIMTELAGSMNPSDFALQWLDQWTFTQTINGSIVPARQPLFDAVIAAWPTLPSGDLDMARAPFRPIAIMLRVDLRSGSGYGQGSAGEARIVYCFIDENCNARKFLPIFEYAINKRGCAIKAWGEAWADLSTMPLGSPQYNDALMTLTRQFTDVTSSPNANHLGQLRTNEFIVRPWELREFHLSSGTLNQTTVALTPDANHNSTPIVGDIMNGVPGLLPGLLAGSALTGFSSLPGQPVAFWNAPNVLVNDDRHDFSLNTCNGCHKRETDTFFTHVSEAPFGTPAPLSGFLTGITVNDPVVPATSRMFNDLDRRRQDLQNLVDTSCFSIFAFQAVARTH